MDNNNNYMLSLNILFWLKSICIQVDFVCIEHHNLFFIFVPLFAPQRQGNRGHSDLFYEAVVARWTRTLEEVVALWTKCFSVWGLEEVRVCRYAEYLF